MRSKIGPGESLSDRFTSEFEEVVRMKGIEEGEVGTALDEFLTKATNLKSFQIFMNMRGINPL